MQLEKLAKKQDAKKIRAAVDSGFDSSSFYNEFLRSSLSKAEALVEHERRFENARQRREKSQLMRESDRRIANMRHAEKSQRALQTRWTGDVERSQKSFAMRSSNQEHVMLRKVRARPRRLLC